MFCMRAPKFIGLAALVALACIALFCAETQAGTMGIWRPSPPATNISAATFWGRPYPFGYAWVYPAEQARSDRDCLQRRKIKTAHGWRVKRVWVCPGRIVRK